MAEDNKKDWNAPLDLRKLENKIEREQSEGRERTKDIQPPIDGITIESIGSDVALVIRSRITDAEVEVLKNWMKENKGELVMAGRYNITKISISPANNIKIRLDNSLAKALDSIGTISNLEYRSGRLEVDPNYTSNPLLDFKNLDHVHVWGGGLALEFERNGRVINPYNETHGLSFSFGTSDGKYKEDQKIFTARTTEISGLSGIDASSFIQTGGGAALLKENAASKNHVDLSTEYREDSLHHAEDARATETTFVKALDYRNTIKNLLLIPKEDWAKIVTEKEEGLKDPAFSMWMDINTPEGMVLDYFARAQGFENSSLLLSDMAESLSKDIILQENVAPVVDFLNDRKRTIDLKRLEGLLEGDEDKQIESLGEIGTRNFLNKITNESFMSYREKALGEEERKKRAERKAARDGSRDSGGTKTAENIPEDTPRPATGSAVRLNPEDIPNNYPLADDYDDFPEDFIPYSAPEPAKNNEQKEVSPEPTAENSSENSPTSDNDRTPDSGSAPDLEENTDENTNENTDKKVEDAQDVSTEPEPVIETPVTETEPVENTEQTPAPTAETVEDTAENALDSESASENTEEQAENTQNIPVETIETSAKTAEVPSEKGAEPENTIENEPVSRSASDFEENTDERVEDAQDISTESEPVVETPVTETVENTEQTPTPTAETVEDTTGNISDSGSASNFEESADEKVEDTPDISAGPEQVGETPATEAEPAENVRDENSISGSASDSEEKTVGKAEETPTPVAETVEDTAENTLDSGSASDEERENGLDAPENAEKANAETVTVNGPAIETSVSESPVLETSARDDGNSKNNEKPEETKGNAKDTASYGPRSIDNFVNTDKILWKQKIEDLDDFLYTRYENGEVKEQLVKKLSDRETYLESNERDLNYKKKAIGGVYNTNDLKTRNEEIDLKLDKAKRNYKEKLDRYNALPNESDKDRLKSDEINPLEKEIKSLSQQKTFIYNQMADSLKIGLEQGRKIALAIYEEFETARQMDGEAVGKYIVSNGSMSFNEASLAGEKKEIINNKVDMDKMIISSARLLMAEGVELKNNIQLSEKDRELFNELKEKASKDGQELNEAEKSSLYKFELREKAEKSLTSDGTDELLTSFIEKYNETIENRKAVESLFCNKYSMFPSTVSITSCRKALEADPEILEAQDKYEKSIADLKETALSFTDKTDSFFKFVRDTSEPENVEKNLYILSGKDGYLEEKDGLLLPMDMFNRAKFFKALTENSGKNNTLLFGQGSSFKYGALSGTGINAIIEKTDFVYEERYNAEKAAREKENADLRETLNSMLFHATGKKDLSSKSLTIEDWENHIRNVFENNPDAAKTALTDIKRKMTAIEKNQAWLNTNCSLDDYITLQSVRGLELKNIWDEKITERSAAYAQNLPTEEINKIVKECTKAQQDYEDFKKDRKTELCTGFAKNAEINIESGNFKFSGKNVNEGNTAEIIDLQKREGSTYEFVGDDDEAEGISGSKYRAAKWRMLKNRVRGVVFDAISSFSRMSVIESILQVLLMLALMTHQLIKRPAEYFKYQFKSMVADDATAERALLGLALENAFDTEKDENGKVIGLIIKDEFREKANHSGVTLSEDGRHFNVDISKATDGKFSGRRVFSFSAIPQTEDTEVIKRRMETLKKREEDARNFTNAYENAQVEKKNKIIQTVAIMEAEAKEAQEINNSYRKQGLIGSDGVTPKDKMKMKDKKITGNIHRTSSPVR